MPIPRGPRADVDVRSLLIDTAERMMGVQPREQISLRAIAREAGVAPAALLHHFPGRDDLVEAVLAKRLPSAIEAVAAGLKALIEKDGSITLHAVTVASLQPLIDIVNDDPVGGFHWLRVYSDLAMTGNPVWRRALAEQTDVLALSHAAFKKAMPDVSDTDVRRRTTIGLYTATVALANADQVGWGIPLGAKGFDPVFVDQLLVFTSAGLAASPSWGLTEGVSRRMPRRAAPRRRPQRTS